MSLPLREPFFRKSRTSILQRAIIMTCVLGALATAATWLAGIGVFAAALTQNSLQTPLLAALALSIATAIVQAPLHHWNHRNAAWTPCTLPYLIVLYLALFHWGQNVSGVERQLFQLACPVVVVTACSLLMLRLDGRHWLALCVALGMVLPPALSALVELAAHAESNTYNGSFEHSMMLTYVSVPYALAVPWGIPFWLPPKRDLYHEESTKRPDEPVTQKRPA